MIFYGDLEENSASSCDCDYQCFDRYCPPDCTNCDN